MTKKVGVLLGVHSAEREISLKTGEAVYRALLAKGYDAVKIPIDENLVDGIKREKIEVAFIATHGKLGEDGTIQGLLELLGVPYVGPGVLASALAMDKTMAKRIFIYEGITTPKFYQIDAYEINRLGRETVLEAVMQQLRFPMVVKPSRQGSTIGMSFVDNRDELWAGIELALQYDDLLLIEEFIEGVEVTASILGNREPRALGLIEIYSKTGRYDYASKYTKGLSEHLIPPPHLTPEQCEEANAMAIRAYKALGCRGMSRVDIIVDKQGVPYVLEVNTIPGMTETSLYPDAARAVGIEFPELMHQLIQLALEK